MANNQQNKIERLKNECLKHSNNFFRDIKGKLIESGENINCYELIIDSDYVIKFLKKENKNSFWYENRRIKTFIITQSLQNEKFCDTIISPSHLEREYFEIQRKVSNTVFNQLQIYLSNNDLISSQNTIHKIYEFEKEVLWNHGIMLLDTKSYLSNFGLLENKIVLFDFDGLESDKELNTLFFEGPWKVFRYQGTMDKLIKSGISGKSLAPFADWYRTFFFKNYHKQILMRYF